VNVCVYVHTAHSGPCRTLPELVEFNTSSIQRVALPVVSQSH